MSTLHDATFTHGEHTLRARVTRSTDDAAYVVSCENVTLESSPDEAVASAARSMRHYLRLPADASLDVAAQCGRDLAAAFYAPVTLASVLFGWGALTAARYRALPCDEHGSVLPDCDREPYEWLAARGRSLN